MSDSFWTLASQGVSTVSNFFVSVLIARNLGADGLGGYAAIVLFVSTVGFLTNPGIYAAANYYLSSNQLSHRRVFNFAISCTAPVAIAAGILTVLGPLDIVTDSEITDNYSMRLAVGVASAFSVFGITMKGIAYGVRRIKLVSRLLGSISILYAIAILLLWTNALLTLANCVLAYCCLQIANGFITTIVALPVRTEAPRISSGELKPFLLYGLSVYSGRVFNFLSQRIDTYLILLLAGQSTLGYYSVAASLAGQAKLIPTSVGMSMMSNIGSLIPEESTRLVNRTSQIILVLMLSCGILLAPIGWKVIPIVYGDTFRASTVPFIIMLTGIVAISSYLVVEPYFQARGVPLVPVRISFVGAVANAVLCLLLIPLYGVIGASIGYTVSYWLQLLITCHAFSKQTRLPWFSLVNISSGVWNTAKLVRDFLRLRPAAGTINKKY